MSTLDRINAAAVKLFGRYGFRQVNMEMIAEEAELSRQGLYLHFPNKEAVFVSVCRYFHESALTAGKAAAASAGAQGADLAAVLGALLETCYEVWCRDLDNAPHADELMAENGRLGGAIATTHYRLLTAAAEQIIRDHVRHHGVKLKQGMTARQLAELLMVTSRGLKIATPALAEFLPRLRQLVNLLVAGAAQPAGAAANRRRRAIR